MNPNLHYQELEKNYLFSEIARRVAEFEKAHPEKEIIRMGIGDVTLPLCRAVVDALKAAAEEMASAETFRGYGPEQGYPFLREAIASYYAARGLSIDPDEVFVSDGAKSDLGNFLDLCDQDNTVLIPDPVYPVYVDTNTMDGRKVLFADATAENGFLPMPDERVAADIIYLCSPNNPTGAVYNEAQLKAWVDYARARDAIILFDAAYEAFIDDPSLPRSIYCIEGARECAIEFNSLSKTAGFTGTRCGWTIVPQSLERKGVSLHDMWFRRQSTKFNGVSYLVQRGAEAVFSPEGQKQISENLVYYKGNAKIITETMEQCGLFYTGGIHSPYIWLQCPHDMESWAFFDHLLTKAGVVGTPGAGFGKNGTNFFRFTAFASRENTLLAMKRFGECL